MYGTVARMQVRPGSADALIQLFDDFNTEQDVPGYVTEYVYRTNEDPNVLKSTVPEVPAV